MTYTVEINGVRHGPFWSYEAAMAWLAKHGDGRRSIVEPMQVVPPRQRGGDGIFDIVDGRVVGRGDVVA